MTNGQIIFNKRFELMEAGIIGTTGRKMTVQWTDDDGQETIKEMPEPEQIHTFKGWQELGYTVKKGQKTRARFTIWNFTTKISKAKRAALEAKGVTPENIPEKGHYFTKEACFFAASQVEKITEAGKAEKAGVLAKDPEKLLPIVWPGLMLPAIA